MPLEVTLCSHAVDLTQRRCALCDDANLARIRELESQLGESDKHLESLQNRYAQACQEVCTLTDRLVSVTKARDEWCERAHGEAHRGDDAEQERDELRSRLSNVIGWRENDWPNWFCRRTAEAVADLARAVDNQKPTFIGMDMASGPDRTGYRCTKCGVVFNTPLAHECSDSAPDRRMPLEHQKALSDALEKAGLWLLSCGYCGKPFVSSEKVGACPSCDPPRAAAPDSLEEKPDRSCCDWHKAGGDLEYPCHWDRV